MGQKDYVNSVNLNRNTDFPYLVLNVVNDDSYPGNPGFQVMHWHEDLQFIYVLSGEIVVATLEMQTPVYAGEGIFLNKNVVHLVKKNSTCHYNSFIFPDYFLKFYFGSPAGEIVERLVGKENFPIFIPKIGKNTLRCGKRCRRSLPWKRRRRRCMSMR